MKLFLTLIFAVLLLASCTAKTSKTLPLLTKEDKEEHGAWQVDCTAIYPKGKWKFVHTIDFTMKNGTGTTVVGITSLSQESIQCALVTIEGLTLFQADFLQDQSIRIHRALPPFDNKSFAEGMMEDIRILFQPPQATSVQKGILSGTGKVCRYTEDDGWKTDVLPNVDDCWKINRYTAELIADRSITGQSCSRKNNSTIPQYLELKNHRAGYELKMTLLRAKYN